MTPQDPSSRHSAAEVELPAAFAARFRRSSSVIGVALIMGALLIYLVALWLTPVIAGSVPTAAVVVLSGVPALFVVGIAVTVMGARGCLAGDRLVVARARRVRRVLIACLVGVLATTGIGAIVVITLADPSVDGLIIAVMMLFIAFFGLIGYAGGAFFIRPTAETLRRFSGGTVW